MSISWWETDGVVSVSKNRWKKNEDSKKNMELDYL